MIYFEPYCIYEPELHPGVTYKLKTPKATLKIFSTGSVTVTAPSVADVQAAIEYIFPLVYEFRKERTKEEKEALAKKKLKLYGELPPNDEDDEGNGAMSEGESWD
ncbi:hypothetical protein NQ317_005229 [Molorchus minor]|uniref:TATA-box binding protein n=1 Tax=Molorchus minor TaxID=1323400 RepID=A0ABQ9JQP0_9CUCU|nr:hypothetical protein NQ317_005229 [Molorchus minor]